LKVRFVGIRSFCANLKEIFKQVPQLRFTLERLAFA
jgi:hypothetical protein